MFTFTLRSVLVMDVCSMSTVAEAARKKKCANDVPIIGTRLVGLGKGDNLSWRC